MKYKIVPQNGVMLETSFKPTRPWAAWFDAIARAVGFIDQALCATATLDFPLVGAGATQDLTVTVKGVKTTDTTPVVSVGVPSGVTAGVVFHGFVSADDQVTVRCTNATAAGIDPASGVFRIEVRRYD